MTRDDNRDRIPSVRRSYGSRKISHLLRFGLIGNRFAERDIPKFVPGANLKIRSMKENWNLKLLQFPFKISVKLFHRLLKRIDYPFLDDRGTGFVTDKSHFDKRGTIRNEMEQPNRAFVQTMISHGVSVSVFHKCMAA